MTNPVIQVENLSKEYILGAHVEPHGTFKDMILNTVSAPVRRLRRLKGQVIDKERFWALRDIDLTVEQGEVLGLIGANGAGKSTLLKILSRITEPTRGRVILRGRVASLLEVGTGFHHELTGRENIYLSGAILGMTRREIRSKFDEIVAFAELEKFIDTPVKRYSSGMYVRLAFAVAAHLEPDILLVDEVLAVGDAAFQKKCLGKMGEVGKQGRTVVFVSHNMSAIQRLCTRGILLDSGRITENGTTDDVINRYLATALKSNDVAGALPAGYLFLRAVEPDGDEFQITGVQLLDVEGNDLELLGTWDPVRFRIHFFARRREPHGSVVLQVQTRDGTTLLLCSTEPDSTVSYQIDPGEHCVDCVFPNWPLSEGSYVLGAGLAIPKRDYLCREDSLCEVHVVGRDVFGSGLAPASNRYLVASPHRWEIPAAIEAKALVNDTVA